MNVNWLNAIIEQRDSELDSPGGSVRGDDEKILWDVRDSNPRPPPCQGDALNQLS